MGVKTASVRNGLLALIACLCGLFVLLPSARGMDFPREGAEAIPNGVAQPFAGHWWVGFPEGEGMINGEPVTTCAEAVELVPLRDDGLVYRSHSGEEVVFELSAFSGRTTWMPEWGESTIVVWITTDEFFAYSVDLTNGKARWDNPLVYRRCET